ncbi:hypothetical protein [Nonomuraea roseoviolacea]|uniref:Uncharacterized protein n=1 Tax=Nonomuraea roseoviolacea subsp. carminata TaxID=160689 RepID=A0ABT1JZD8_9ACTN|nr:hypothetical protein [Nonomuraea roseoviolacea]MCP2347118.1 hypothetical protein [Nonomuraea roseoviolacea subsp. carminata]
MLITGFESHPLTESSHLLSDPVFWALHSCQIGADGLDDLEEAFGVDIVYAEELHGRVFDHDHWPVFTVPLRSTSNIHIVYRNLDGDMGLDYVLTHPGWPHDLHLATVDGNFIGPGLSWPELITIANRPPTSGRETLLDPASRLLILLPALGDADLPDTAVPTVAAALSELTTSPQPARIAETLLRPNNHAYWEPATWQQLSNGAMVCDEPHSRRCPGASGAFTLEQAITVTRALAGTDNAEPGMAR